MYDWDFRKYINIYSCLLIYTRSFRNDLTLNDLKLMHIFQDVITCFGLKMMYNYRNNGYKGTNRCIPIHYGLWAEIM